MDSELDAAFEEIDALRIDLDKTQAALIALARDHSELLHTITCETAEDARDTVQQLADYLGVPIAWEAT